MKKMTDDEFKAYAINETNKILAKDGIKVHHAGDVRIWGCEWCDRSSRVVCLNYPSVNGWGGVLSFFEDKHFRPQSEWFVCGQCKDS